MAETSIQWADYTFNPWVGCQRVSPGCEHCYAEAYDKRVGGAPIAQRDDPSKPQLRWGPKAERVRTSVALWKQPFKWNREAEKTGRRRVFCASLADVFDLHESISAAWRLELFSIIRQTPHLTWMLLTKRPENFYPALSAATSVSARHGWDHYMGSPEGFEETRLWLLQWLGGGRPPANVWVGTTVEDRRRAYERVPLLLDLPAEVRFLSVEPLLEPVKLQLDMHRVADGVLSTERIDWVIVGGESGGKARRFEAAWARSIVKQCRAARVPVFVKQLGAFVVDRNDVGFEAENETWAEGPDAGQPTRPEAWPSPRGIEDSINGYREEQQGADVRVRLRDSAGGDPAEWPLDLRVREFPEVHHG